MEFLSPIWLKILEIFQSFWTKVIIAGMWSYVTMFFHLQFEAHVALSVVLILDFLTGTAHARMRGEFNKNYIIGKTKIKLFAYAIIVLTGWAIDFAVTKGHIDLGVHYSCVVILVLTEAKSIAYHLEAFKIKIPFKKKIDKLLNNLYNR